MRTLYIGGQSGKKSSGISWKIYMFLFLLIAFVATTLKFTGSILVERWINKRGADPDKYAFSVRDVELSISRGQMILSDVKVINPQNSVKLIEVPSLTVKMSLFDLISQSKNLIVEADQVDLLLSKDFTSELERIQALNTKDLYLDSIEGKIGQLNIIEKKEDQSRTILGLQEVMIKVKEVGLLSINKNTEFNLNSTISSGGKFNLTGKAVLERGLASWSLKGAMKQVPADIFNKIAGDKLPFAFTESTLNADFTAKSEDGKVSGEIVPDIKRLNLIDERPGVPTQTIARALTEDLTFSLPFTLKEELSLHYENTFRRLKMYKRYPAADPSPKVSQNEKTENSSSFWPF